MEWREIISDYKGLVRSVIDKINKKRFGELTGRDKGTINGWLVGGTPKDPRSVATVIRLALRSQVDISRFQSFKPIFDFSSMMSYEEKVDSGPPDLSWLADPGVEVPDTTIHVCGVAFDCPIGIASSPLVGDDRWTALMLNLRFGISTFKTRTAGHRLAWDPPYIAFAKQVPDLKNYDPKNPPTVEVTFKQNGLQRAIPIAVNSIGVPSESNAEWQGKYERIRRHASGGNVGISVMGEGNTQEKLVHDFDLAVEMACELTPPFIELNISCPNLEKKCDLTDNPELVKEICRRARKLTKDQVPLFIKIPWLTFPHLKLLLETVGDWVDAIVYKNTIRVRPLKRQERDDSLHPAFVGREFGGLSGPCTYEFTRAGVRGLCELRKSLRQKFSIIAVGGVSSAADVFDLMNEGADAVQACTAPMFDPLLALKTRYHLEGCQEVLRRKPTLDHPVGYCAFPRNDVEKQSYRSLEDACREIHRRFPEREIPYELFVSTWNSWMASRAAQPLNIGRAQRLEKGKTKSDWIKELL